MSDVSASREVHKSKRLAGDEGVWFFITADVAMFAVFFAVFMDGRSRSLELFEQSRRMLDPTIGLVNTLILLTSSWFMAMAVHDLRHQNRAGLLRNLWLCVGVGSLFAFSKGFEYSQKFAHGISLRTNEFFSYYFIFTGIHFLHFVIGVIAIGICLFTVRRNELNSRTTRLVESVGCYWHMVDMLWIVLFAMIYLLRAA